MRKSAVSMSKKNIKPSTTGQQAPRNSDLPAESGAAGPFSNLLFLKISLSLSAFAALLYANTLGHGYVLDDLLAITENSLVKKGISAIGELLSSHYRVGTEGAGASALLYRPLSLVTFALEWTMAPGSPFVAHLMNVLWYSATVGLLFNTLRITFRGYHWMWAAGSALLFAVHPLHTEVVANIKSRDELLSLFFCVAALYVWVRALQRPAAGRTILALFFYFLALLSKESAVTFLPAFPFVGWFFFEKTLRQSAAHGALFALPVAVFLLLRAWVFSQTADNFTISAFDNPIVEAEAFGERAATGFMALWQYFRLLVFPHPLVSDYSYQHLTVVGWTNWQAIAGLLLVGGLAFWTLRGLSQRRPDAFLSGMFLAGIVLYSQLLIVIGVLVGERLMYAPSLWFCAGLMFWLLKGTGWDLRQKTQDPAAVLSQPGSKAVIWTLALVSVAFSLKTFIRNFDWTDNFSLFSADVQHAPGSFRIQNGIGNALSKRIKDDLNLSVAEREEMLAQLEFHARAAIAIRPEANSYLNLGNAAIIRRQYESAVAMFDSALVFAPQYEPARRNIAQCYLALGKKEMEGNKNWEKAADLLKKSIEYDSNNSDAYVNLGTSYGRMGRISEAIANFEKAAELNPDNLYAWRFLAFAHRTTGNLERAATCEEKVRALETKK